MGTVETVTPECIDDAVLFAPASIRAARERSTRFTAQQRAQFFGLNRIQADPADEPAKQRTSPFELRRSTRLTTCVPCGTTKLNDDRAGMSTLQ